MAASSRLVEAVRITARPVPQETVIVGIDGGYVRNWHDKKHNFEVIVGKSMPEDRDHRYFGLVDSQDDAARAPALRGSAPGPAGDQPVTMLTDGGDSVRALAGVMAPGAGIILDWFHIAMRLTGLGQYTKGLAHHNPVEATAAGEPAGADQVAALARRRR